MELTGLPRDLLNTARTLLGCKEPTEATARRAVSTAYYSLFHLLTEEACLLWTVPEHRSRLARQFDHRRMREASEACARECSKSSEVGIARLCRVANAFVRAQQSRHKADYDRATVVTQAEAEWEVWLVELAFFDWPEVREQPAAKDYLFSLLFRER